jgi:sugar transferase (PEP-CTERM/EpsH1 system associated)
MRILFCCPEVPYPLDAGLKVRVFNLACRLADRHDVYLFCLSRGPAAKAALKAVQAAGMKATVVEKPPMSFTAKTREYLIRLMQGVPPSFILSWEGQIARVLESLETRIRFDVVVAEHLFMARYALLLKAPKVLVEHNVEWQLAAALAKAAPRPVRWWMQAESYWIRAYGQKMIRAMQGEIAVSAPDKEALGRLSAGASITLVDNGVDVDQYCKMYQTEKPLLHRLLFIGLMSYQPNEEAVMWFVKDILPRIREQYPDTVLTIAGADPSPRLHSLGRETGIKVIGAVTDVKPLCQGSSVLVVPLRLGGGSRLKILEAFAAGTPVVSTKKGAEGLDAKHERHLLIADSARDFATAVSRLYEDKELYQELKENARRLVEEKYDWSILASRMEAALAAVTRTP